MLAAMFLSISIQDQFKKNVCRACDGKRDGKIWVTITTFPVQCVHPNKLLEVDCQYAIINLSGLP